MNRKGNRSCGCKKAMRREWRVEERRGMGIVSPQGPAVGWAEAAAEFLAGRVLGKMKEEEDETGNDFKLRNQIKNFI